jgi:hypothetical protein
VFNSVEFLGVATIEPVVGELFVLNFRRSMSDVVFNKSLPEKNRLFTVTQVTSMLILNGELKRLQIQ